MLCDITCIKQCSVWWNVEFYISSFQYTIMTNHHNMVFAIKNTKYLQLTMNWFWKVYTKYTKGIVYKYFLRVTCVHVLWANEFFIFT